MEKESVTNLGFRRHLLIALIVSSVIFLAYFFLTYLDFGNRRKTDEIRRVRIGVQDNAIVALVAAAEQLGFFEEAGLTTEIKRYPSGKLALEAMLKGEVDVATVADVPVMAKSFEREDFAVFACIAQSDRSAWVVARRDRGIETAKDLRGKRIATQEWSAVEYFLDSLLLMERIDNSEVDEVFMPAVELPAALSSGSVDAISMRNPFNQQAAEALGDNAVEIFGDESVYNMYFSLAASNQYLNANRDEVMRLLWSLRQAEIFAALNPEKVSEATIEFFGEERRDNVLQDFGRYKFVLSLPRGFTLNLESQAEWKTKKEGAVGLTIPHYDEFVRRDFLDGLISGYEPGEGGPFHP